MVNFLVRRWVRTERGTNQKEYREFTVSGTRITVGRAIDQHLQIADPAVALSHAVIQLRGRNRLTIRTLTSNPVHVNGKALKSSRLTSGDSIEIGPARISVDQANADTFIFTLDHFERQEPESLDALHHTDFSHCNLSKSSWSWVLVFSVSTLFLLIPLAGVIYPPISDLLRERSLLPDDTLWSSGPLNPAHQFIGKNCNACHKKPFESVRNPACTACHDEVQHHVDVQSTKLGLFDESRCISCHREHNEPDILIQRDSRLCTDCHARLDQLTKDKNLKNVSDFSEDHPEFRPTLLIPAQTQGKTHWKKRRVAKSPDKPHREQSFLKFSHKDHLNPAGIQSPNGDKVLSCADCHQPLSSGLYLMPIKMENRCARCHQLLYDENDLESQIPHGKLEELYKSLEMHFSRQFLGPNKAGSHSDRAAKARRPGGEARIASQSEQRRALDWAERQSLRIARELLEDRLCSDCHEISKIPGKEGFEQWHLEPPVLAKRWMPLAQFNHASHTTEKCTTCHQDADKSERSSDVLLPEIAVCRECHGGAEDPVKIPSDCLMCHRFHLPERGLLDPSQRQAAEKVGVQASPKS